MFWQSGTPSSKWCYGSFFKKTPRNRLTTSIFINRINVLLAVEGELLVEAGFSRGHSGVVKGMDNV